MRLSVDVDATRAVTRDDSVKSGSEVDIGCGETNVSFHFHAAVIFVRPTSLRQQSPQSEIS